METRQTKIVSSATENLVEVRNFVGESARRFGFADEEVSKIVLAVDEACSNIIKHAYANARDKQISVTIICEGGRFEISIIDKGKTFDPSMYHEPDLKRHLSEFRRGGLGMYLMKTLMDAVEYQFVPGTRNEVRLVKFLANPRKSASS